MPATPPQPPTPSPRSPILWTTADLELFAGDRVNRYEIIDGELFVTRAPHWKHQNLCVNIGAILKDWSDRSGLGETAIMPGIIFSDVEQDELASPILPGFNCVVGKFF
nr:Uma2 family endonuclease [Pseudanabaena sp. PCC 6802]